jgi:vitamin B12 transporter
MKRLAILAALSAASVSVGLQAAETENQTREKPLDNIVVTGHLTPTSIKEVSSSFSRVDREVFEKRQAIFATDVLQDLPSLSVSRSGTFGSTTAIRIRGAEANQVMVMIDGVRANDLANDDAFDFSNLTSYDIESVEVLRGPQSALYGSDAMAGVINVITRRADKPFDAGAFLEAGSFDTVNAGARIGAAKENSNISLGASWLQTDGTNISRVGPEDDGYQNLTLSFNAGGQPSENTGLEFMARYTDSSNDFDDGDFGAPVDADRYTDAQRTYVQGKGDIGLLDEHWTHELRLNWVDTRNTNIYDGALNTKADGERVGVYYQTGFGLDGQAVTETNHAMTLAVDYRHEDWQQRGPLTSWGGDPNVDASLDITGLVGEYRAQPVEDWALSLALRYDDNSDFKNIGTWRATTSYLFSGTHTRVRGTAGTGQKNPTFTERFGAYSSATSGFVGNPDLRPEESQGWDVGVDQGFFDQRLMIETTYFREQLEDEINSLVSLGGGLFTAANQDGASDRKGVEIALQGDIGAGFDATASYTYTDADEQVSSGDDRVREIRRPRHMAAANLNYGFLNQRANTNLNVSYTGEQTDYRFLPGPPYRETVSLDAYTLVNLTASYRLTQAVTVTARVDNLLDEDYEDVYGFATPGRGGYLGVRMRFAN